MSSPCSSTEPSDRDPNSRGEDEEREESGEARTQEQPAAPAERGESSGGFNGRCRTREGPKRGQEDGAQDGEASTKLAGKREEGDEEERRGRDRGEDEAAAREVEQRQGEGH